MITPAHRLLEGGERREDEDEEDEEEVHNNTRTLNVPHISMFSISMLSQVLASATPTSVPHPPQCHTHFSVTPTSVPRPPLDGVVIQYVHAGMGSENLKGLPRCQLVYSMVRVHSELRGLYADHPPALEGREGREERRREGRVEEGRVEEGRVGGWRRGGWREQHLV